MDWPLLPILPLHVHTCGTLSACQRACAFVGAGTASYNWPAQYMAVFVPVVIPWPYPVARVFWGNGASAGGNMDFGIYALGGAKIYSTGATAASGSSVTQYVTPSTPFMLSPGTYLFALQNDSATTTGRAVGPASVTANEGRLAGLFQQAVGSSGLPTTPTLAQWASTGLPLCGVTRTASGY